MIKAAFFDVDNTLYDWRGQRFIPSGIETVKKAKKAGVKVFLCSARPYASIKEFGVMSLGITWNGVIANCGAYVCVGNRTLKTMFMQKEDVRKLCKIALKNSLTMEIVTPRTRYLIAPGNNYLKDYHGTYSDTVPGVHPYRGEGVTGILLFAPEEYDEAFHSVLPHLIFYRFHPCGVDIGDGEHLKGEGIQAVLDHLGITKEEAISFGDDFQDISMGDSSIFVCVGNGKEEVKLAADYVCPDIVDDGIEVALRKYGVIK